MKPQEEMKSEIKILQNPKASWKPLRPHCMKEAKQRNLYTPASIQQAPELIYTVKDRILTIHISTKGLKTEVKMKTTGCE